MEREQEEKQFLGFFGIIKESIKIIFTWRNFLEITLPLVLPLFIIILTYTDISDLLMAKTLRDQRALNYAKPDTPEYNKLSNLVTLDLTELCLSTLACFVLVLIISLLSTSTVVYAIACVYTSRPITYERVISVVPKVGKRLMITQLWSFIAVFIYIVHIVATFLICYFLFEFIHSPAVVLILGFILLILFLFGLAYISVVSDLAGVISVLEDIYGIQAMFKSMNLVKGKVWISIAIKILLTFGSMAIHRVFHILMANVYGSGLLRFGVAVFCYWFLLMLILVGLVAQTVIYFVCKSYHDENINKTALLLAEHVSLQGNEKFPEQLDV